MDVFRKESKPDRIASSSVRDNDGSPRCSDLFLKKTKAAVSTVTGGSDDRTPYLPGPYIKPRHLLETDSSREEAVFEETNPNSNSGRNLIFDDQANTESSNYKSNGHDRQEHVEMITESSYLQEIECLQMKSDCSKANASLEIRTSDGKVKENTDRSTYAFPGTEMKSSGIQERVNVGRKTGDFQRNQSLETKTDYLEGSTSIESMRESRVDSEPLNLSVHLESCSEHGLCFSNSTDRFTSPSLDAQQISAGILVAVISEAEFAKSTACPRQKYNQDSPKGSLSRMQSGLGLSKGHLQKSSLIENIHSDTELPVTKETYVNLSGTCARNDDSVMKIHSKEEFSPTQETGGNLSPNEDDDKQNGVDGTENAINLPYQHQQESLKKKKCSRLSKFKLLNFAQKETESTKRVTVWSVGIFHRWMNKDKEMSMLPQLIKMTVPQINTYLCKFLVHARKIDGTRYPSKSLQALGQGLLRYVRNNRVYQRRECGSTEGIFKPINQVLAMELRRTMYYEELAGRTPKVRQRRRPLPTKSIPTAAVENSQKMSEDLILPDSSVTCMQEGNAETDMSTELDGKKQSGLKTECLASGSQSKPLEREACDTETNTNVCRSVKKHKEQEAIASYNISTEKLPRTSSKETEESHMKKSTEKNTRWAVHIFNKWRVSKQREGTLLIPEIQDMSVKDVNSHLVEFITTVVKTDGSEYIPSCLYSMACGLLRYTRNHSRYDLDFMNSKDERFTEFQTALSHKIKSLEPENTEERQKLLPLRRLSSGEEDKLWRYHVFGMETAKSLQYTVLYYNFKIFEIKSYAQHRCLQRYQFSIVNEGGVRVLRFNTLQLDPNTGGEDGKRSCVITFRNQHEEHDIVGLYEVYFEAIGKSGPFYKRLVGFQGPILRFTEQNVGIRSLQAMWFDICEAVRLETD